MEEDAIVEVEVRDSRSLTRTQEQKDDLQRQIYTATLRGMRPAEIKKQFNINSTTVDRYINRARKERLAEYQQSEKNDQDGAMVFFLDHIQTLRSSMFSTLQELRKTGSKSNNIAGIYNALIHLIEIEAKAKGILTNRITGGDGIGPVEITAVANKNEVIEEIKRLMSQEEQLTGTKLLELDDDEDEYEDENEDEDEDMDDVEY